MLGTSVIAKSAPIREVKGVLVDESFNVAPGIRAELAMVVNAVNFATTELNSSSEGFPFVYRVVHESEPED